MSEKTTHKIIRGSSLDILPELEEESIDFSVTSPPYWQIKDYEHPHQIGRDQEYEEYLSALKQVWEEVHRLLKPGCRLAINIGDQYLRASEYGRYRVKPIPADTTRICRDIGFDFMGNIIWRKVSTTNTTGGGTWMGSTYYPKDGHVTYEHEYILLFRKRGDWNTPGEEAKEKSKLTKEQRSRWFRGYWELSPERQDEHVAMFPMELPERLIQMYSFHGETVLDPFLGSGTTTRAAMKHGRNSVGVELNDEFFDVICNRIGLHENRSGEIEEEGEKTVYRDSDSEIRLLGFPQTISGSASGQGG